MEDIKTQIVNLNKLWELAPEELKKDAPQIIINATGMLTTASLNIKEIQPLKSIAKHLVEGAQVSQEKAKTLLNNSKHPFVVKNKDSLLQRMTSNVATSDVTSEDIQKLLRSNANIILTIGILWGGICAAIEGYKTYKFWELIKDARNLIERSPGQRERISKQLDDIKLLVKSLDKAIADLRKNDAGDDFDCAKIAADHFINEIRIKVGEFLNEINNLYVEINGIKEQLRINRNISIISAFSGTFSAGTGVSNAIIASRGNLALIIIGLVIAGLNGIIAITNVTLNIISKKDLKELQKEIENIEKIRDEGLNIQNDVNQKSREIIFLTKECNSKFDLNKYN